MRKNIVEATKEAKIDASSTTSTPNSGSEAKTENKERETKRHPNRKTKEVEEHGTGNVDTYESIGGRPATSMQSNKYCELNLSEQEEPKAKSLTSTIPKDKKQGSEAIDAYEMLSIRSSAAMQPETYCELQIMGKKKS